MVWGRNEAELRVSEDKEALALDSPSSQGIHGLVPLHINAGGQGRSMHMIPAARS